MMQKATKKFSTMKLKAKQFINADGEPVVAFDKGYGMAQLTKPVPTYEQVWNWKENNERRPQTFSYQTE